MLAWVISGAISVGNTCSDNASPYRLENISAASLWLLLGPFSCSRQALRFASAETMPHKCSGCTSCRAVEEAAAMAVRRLPWFLRPLEEQLAPEVSNIGVGRF